MTCKKEPALAFIIISGLAILNFVPTLHKLHSNGIESRINRLEKQMKQVGVKNSANTFGAKFADARPTKQEENWFISGGLLYYKPFVGGTEVAFTDTGARLSYPIQSEIKGIRFDMALGFRVGLGYNFNRDGWDIQGEYTHFGDGNSQKTDLSGCGSDNINPTREALCPEPNSNQSSTWIANYAGIPAGIAECRKPTKERFS